MREAMDRVGRPERNNNTATTTKADILEYLAFSMYKQGDLNAALNITNELLEIQPNHAVALRNKIGYERELKEEKQLIEETKKREKYEKQILQDHETFKKLCRGEELRPTAEVLGLRCRFVTNDDPFLVVAPFKVEELNLSPYIVVFHDVLSDSEIATIKSLSKPRVSVWFIKVESTFHFLVPCSSKEPRSFSPMKVSA